MPITRISGRKGTAIFLIDQVMDEKILMLVGLFFCLLGVAGIESVDNLLGDVVCRVGIEQVVISCIAKNICL